MFSSLTRPELDHSHSIARDNPPGSRREETGGRARRGIQSTTAGTRSEALGNNEGTVTGNNLLEFKQAAGNRHSEEIKVPLQAWDLEQYPPWENQSKVRSRPALQSCQGTTFWGTSGVEHRRWH